MLCKTMAVNSPQVNKGRTFHIHMLAESFCIVFQKYISRQGCWLGLVLNLFLFTIKFQARVLIKFLLQKMVVLLLTKNLVFELLRLTTEELLPFNSELSYISLL